MFNHRLRLGLGIVNKHIKADNCVEGAAKTFQIGGAELHTGNLEACLGCPPGGFLHHCLRNIAGGNARRTQLG